MRLYTSFSFLSLKNTAKGNKKGIPCCSLEKCTDINNHLQTVKRLPSRLYGIVLMLLPILRQYCFSSSLRITPWSKNWNVNVRFTWYSSLAVCAFCRVFMNFLKSFLIKNSFYPMVGILHLTTPSALNYSNVRAGILFRARPSSCNRVEAKRGWWGCK